MDEMQDVEQLLHNNPELAQEDMVQGSAPPAPIEGIAGPISEIDPERLKLLEQNLKKFKESQEQTASGSEAPAIQFNPADWEVEPELEHLYLRSQFEPSPEGPKWFIMEHQYMIQIGQWHIDHSGQPKGKDSKGRMQYHAKGLDHVINDIVNGPEGMYSREKGWRLSALLPGAMGQGIAVFERQVKRALPDPKPIEKPEERPLEEATDEELARMQERAKAWTEGDGEAATEAQAAIDAIGAGIPEKTIEATDEGTSNPAAGITDTPVREEGSV